MPTICINDATFYCDVASEENERTVGLMNQQSIPLDYGMVFDFHNEQIVHMYMKDTYVPLGMIFFNEDWQVVRVVDDCEPLSEQIISSHFPCRYVLEISAGLCDELGIRPGCMAELREQTSMGASSSVQGPVATIDPILTRKRKKDLPSKKTTQPNRPNKGQTSDAAFAVRALYPVEEQKTSFNVRSIAGDVIYSLGKDLVKSFGNALFSTGPKDKPDDDVDEDLQPSSGVKAYIRDFQTSKNKRFKGKSKDERRRMAIGSWYAAKRKGK